MNERAFLLCEIVGKSPGRKHKIYKLRSKFFDGGVFELEVESTEVKLINNKSAWLIVDCSGVRDGVASITLPRPVLNMGHRISVPFTSISKTGIVPKK